jgi:polygalacturonase
MKNVVRLLGRLSLVSMMQVGVAAPLQSPGGACDVTAYGARGDGKSLDTMAIQRAVDACAARGGGAVLLQGGTFLSGTIVLDDNITLHISAGAALLASPRIEDFQPFPPEDVPLIAIDGSTQNKGNGPYHLIHASGKQNVAIEGAGAILGNGRAYWDHDPVKVFVSRRPRPTPLIEFVRSSNIRIENVSIKDAAGWTIHPLESDGVMIRGVRIMNDDRGPNTDGVNIDSSRNVVISDTHIEAGDDCIVLKTTGRRGGRAPATENVTISNTVCSSDDQGFKIGTESLGDFRNITFTNAVIFHSPRLYRAPTAAISMSMVDGATFENVIVSNVVIRDAHTPLFLRLGNRGRGQKTPTPGVLRNVVFSNIVATGGTLASSITGLPGHPVRDVTLSDIDITMVGGQSEATVRDVPEAEADYPHAPMFGPLPAHGLYVRHAEGVTLRNVRLRVGAADARPAAVFDEVRDLQLEGVRPAGNSPIALQLNDVVSALIDATRPIGADCGVVRVTGSRSERIHISESSSLNVVYGGRAQPDRSTTAKGADACSRQPASQSPRRVHRESHFIAIEPRARAGKLPA